MRWPSGAKETQGKSWAKAFVNISIPRWIVEERPDATNVNNWHWTEKNADAWSKAKIKVEEL